MPTLPKVLTTADAAGQQLVLVNGQAQAIMTTATGSSRLVNLQTGEAMREFPKPEVPLSDLALAPNNAFVLMSTSDGRTRLINFNDHSPTTKFSFVVFIGSRALVPKSLKYELI